MPRAIHRGKSGSFVPRGPQFMQPSAVGILKPENALSRSEQLLKVGQINVAIQSLYDVITDSQYRRRQWNKTFEGVMLKFIELAVDSKKIAMIKEALHKYRALCSHLYAQSLELVVRHLVQLSLTKLHEAQEVAASVYSKVTEDLEDSTETPFSLLLEAAGTEQTKDRTDRQKVIPWMRFVWEVFRIILDILKGNAKLEFCYNEMAAKAFTFCQNGKRVVEFRRLCDILRQHLNQLIKYPRSTANDVQISNPDTIQRFMDTRFLQLNTAIELELWQEAYRTCEDIHTLMGLSKKALKAQMMVNYYKRLVEIFRASDNILFHACSLYRLYVLLLKHHKGVSTDELRTIASRLVLSVFCIPVYDQHKALVADYFSQLDVAGWASDGTRQARMASLLGYAAPPSRQNLVAEVQSRSVLDNCQQNFRNLYSILESDIDPLHLGDQLEPIVAVMEEESSYREYVTPLKRVAVFRLLQQLYQLYDSLDLDRLSKLARFCSISEIEKIALESLKARVLQVRIDHQNHCIRFQTNLFGTEEMRSHLKVLSCRLIRAVEKVSRREGFLQKEHENKIHLLNKAMEIYHANAEEEHKQILSRKGLIEQRKEEQEKRIAQAEMEARAQLSLEQQRKEEEERRKVQEDAKRRTFERIEREMKERDKAEISQLKKELHEKGAVDAEEEELNDAEYLLMKKKEAELKKKRETERKLQNLAKRLDYMDRALREQQWSLVKKKQQEDAERWVKLVQETAEKIVEDARKCHEQDLKDKSLYHELAEERQLLTSRLLAEAKDALEQWKEEEEEARQKRRPTEQQAASVTKKASDISTEATENQDKEETLNEQVAEKTNMATNESNQTIETEKEAKNAIEKQERPMTWSEKIRAKRMQQGK
eukprot:jgi/Galph1/2743/GphlegSOOS_G1384.1